MARYITEILEKTINNCLVEVVINGAPIDLSKILKINKPILRVRYELKPKAWRLKQIIKKFVHKI